MVLITQFAFDTHLGPHQIFHLQQQVNRTFFNEALSRYIARFSEVRSWFSWFSLSTRQQKPLAYFISRADSLQEALFRTTPADFNQLCARQLSFFAPHNTYNEEGKTSLILAVEQQDYPLAEALLKRQANPNLARYSVGRTPLAIAKSNGDEAMVELLKRYGADCNKANEEDSPSQNGVLMPAHEVGVGPFDGADDFYQALVRVNERALRY